MLESVQQERCVRGSELIEVDRHGLIEGQMRDKYHNMDNILVV